MPRIRLIRAVDRPARCGPLNGQYALQRALRARNIAWLTMGGNARGDEIPWFWCWMDRQAAARHARSRRPFVVGPNILFEDSRRPCRIRAEREICRAASCRLLFTESDWYARLIDRHRGSGNRDAGNRAPIVQWPYPIDPRPGNPLPARHELLIYAKSGYRRCLVDRLCTRYPNARVIRYGHYRREELFDAARRSRVCLYLSDDDRGPLALAEILLAGCPAVGIARGAPFIRPGHTGVLVDRLTPRSCTEAIDTCLQLDRHEVATTAAEQFDTGRIVDTVLAALGEVARQR